MASRLADGASTLLGAILAATPLALWIAWTATVLFIVVAVATASAMLLVLLAERAQRGTGRAAAGSGQVVLPEEFVEEIHRLFPLTYHHSGAPAARYRRVMDRLSRMTGAR